MKVFRFLKLVGLSVKSSNNSHILMRREIWISTLGKVSRLLNVGSHF